MVITATEPLSKQLPTFFEAYARTRSDSLGSFASNRCKAASPVIDRTSIDVKKLAPFLADLEGPLIASRQGAFHFDPWEVAGLGCVEVRNAGVLAWLLNPRGSHGLGFAATKGLLTTVNRHFHSIFNGDFSLAPGRFCRVCTEINPNGEIDDRVDIEIDAELFYLIIEVKIWAPEQAGQLERYCRQAEQRAGARPWAVVLLTPQGRKPSSGGKYADSGRIVSLSWKKLASALEREFPSRRATSDQAVTLSRQIAEQAAQRFLKKMRSL